MSPECFRWVKSSSNCHVTGSEILTKKNLTAAELRNCKNPHTHLGPRNHGNAIVIGKNQMNVLGSVFLGDAQRQRVLSQSTATPPTSPRSSSPQTQVFPQRMGGTSTFPRVDAGQASSSSPLPIEPKLSLELRIRWLEVLLLGVRHDNWDQGVISRSTGGSKDLSNHPKTDAETLVRKAEGAQKRFNGIVNGNDGLRKFIDRCELLR